jgi:hypothetical protein
MGEKLNTYWDRQQWRSSHPAKDLCHEASAKGVIEAYPIPPECKLSWKQRMGNLLHHFPDSIAAGAERKNKECACAKQHKDDPQH